MAFRAAAFQEKGGKSCPFEMAESSIGDIAAESTLPKPNPAENTGILEPKGKFGGGVQISQIRLKAAVGKERCVVEWRWGLGSTLDFRGIFRSDSILTWL